MKKHSHNRGLYAASFAVSLGICVLFSSVYILGGLVSPSTSVSHVVKLDKAAVMVDFVVYDRPATDWQTVILTAHALPGHKPAAEPRCNSPGEQSPMV